MKKKLSQRITSAFLVVVMVLLMIPLNVINIWADSNSDYKVPTTGHKLLSTYNALTGTDISAGSADIVSSIKIFNNDMLEQLFSEHSAYVPMYDQLGEVHQGSDLISFSNSAGVSLSSSVGANVGVEKLFKASTNHKFDLSGDFSYSKAVETYFYDYVVSVQKGYYSFDENLLKEIRNYENDYLRGSFINALTGEDGTTPEEFFAIYGTHIITRYTAGGVAGIYSSSTRTKESSTVELKTLYSQNSEASASAEGIDVGAKNALELQLKIKGEEESNKFETSQKVYAYGGSEAVAFKTDSDGNATEFLFQDWANSIDENNANVLVDKRLHLTPIWELLPDTGYEERIIDLTTYFIEKSEESDKIFYQKFGLENYEFDYSKDWLGFDNCQIITNETQLNDIRDDLSGVYVLANDIVLSEYANWTPIGTKDEPFRGRFYGNNNTISGLNISTDIAETSDQDVLIGLFGCNDGLITDVKVSGNIEMPEIITDNVYIGAIAAYNDGIVNNCFDDVVYDVAYTSVDNFKLPIDSQNIESNKTYSIGNELGIYLVGQAEATYSNVNIVIEESENVGPVYIVIEDVNITGNSADGTIYNKTSRPVYLISKGTSNTIKGMTGAPGAPAINSTNSNLHIFGDAEISIYGGDGSTGATGAVGSSGAQAGPGNPGNNGGCAIDAKIIYVSVFYDRSVNIYGGNGGQGGTGGTGEDGHFKEGLGGSGGTGGSGRYAILTDSVYFISGEVYIYGGAGGAGGTGGYAHTTGVYKGKPGAGGTGGNGSNAMESTTSILCYNSKTVVVGGIAGSGGSGGWNSKNEYASNGGAGTSASPRVDMYIGNKRYVLHDEQLTWTDAKISAEELGGYLATITSEEENALIYEMIGYGALSNYYIGAERAVDGQNVWSWVTGETFEFADWNDGEPNDTGSTEDYVGIQKATMGWNDYPVQANGYIVEYDLESSDEIITDNIISGIVIGHNTSYGKLKKSNNLDWNDNPLKITEVTKTEYYSTNKAFGTLFNSDTVKVVNDGIDGTLKYTGSFSNSGIAAITVTCGDYQRLVPIRIIQTVPTHIEITTHPKTEYEIWDEFDILGIVLTADYNDGSTKEITATNSDLKFTVPDMNSLGEKEVKITFLNTEAFYVINVEKRTVTGTVQIIGTPEVNNTLSAKILSISDANAKDSVTYQWFVDGVEQSTADTMLVKETMAGKTAVLKVSGVGNYRGSFESSIEIRKKEQSAPVTPPQIVSITDTNVILETTAGMQYTYCIGDVSSPNSECVWQPSGEFEGLLPNTTYSFFSRMAESQTANASASSGANVVKTLKTTISGSVTVSGTAKVGETLSADTSSVNAGTSIAYQWYRNGSPITSAVYDSYTLTEADEGAEIYVIVSGTNSFTGVLQSNFVTVETDDIDPTAPTIVVDSKNAVIGENVKINVNLKNNPGITSARVTVTYDPSILKLEDVLYNTSIGGQAVYPENIDSINGSLILYWADGFNNMSEDCAFATLTFRVSDTAVTGSSTTVSVSYDSEDIYDVTETNVTFVVVSGDITIINYVPGDINDDGAVNSKDTTRLMRYLAGWDVEVNELALDVNGDGVVNSKDTTRLMRYLAGWDVEIY